MHYLGNRVHSAFFRHIDAVQKLPDIFSLDQTRLVD